MKTKRKRIKIPKGINLEKLVRHILYTNLTEEELRELDKTIKEENNKDFSNYDE